MIGIVPSESIRLIDDTLFLDRVGRPILAELLSALGKSLLPAHLSEICSHISDKAPTSPMLRRTRTAPSIYVQPFPRIQIVLMMALATS
jgi:hypothetical protein